FHVSYNEAIESRRTPEPGRFRSLVVLYRASPDYAKLADSTRAQWSPWLDRISDYFGDLRIAQFDRPEKIRPAIRRWRSRWTDKPRTADYALQFYPASSRSGWRRAALRAIRARGLSGYIAGTGRKLFGPMPTSPR